MLSATRIPQVITQAGTRPATYNTALDTAIFEGTLEGAKRCPCIKAEMQRLVA